MVLSYARGDLFEKRRSLMTAWASYVTEEAGTVVAFSRISAT